MAEAAVTTANLAAINRALSAFPKAATALLGKADDPVALAEEMSLRIAFELNGILCIVEAIDGEAAVSVLQPVVKNG